MGGPNTKRKGYPIQLVRTWRDEPNRHREPKGFAITGLEYGNVTIPTRIHQWTVKYQAAPLIKVFSIADPLNPIVGPPLAPLNWHSDSFEKIRLHAS